MVDYKNYMQVSKSMCKDFDQIIRLLPCQGPKSELCVHLHLLSLVAVSLMFYAT